MAVADPSSVFVQSTAASALGFLGRRAGAERSLDPTRAIVEALMPALSMELCAARAFNSQPFYYCSASSRDCAPMGFAPKSSMYDTLGPRI